MEFRIVVWNLKGLSTTSESSRLERAEKAFRVLSEDNETAVFALVELGSEDILEHLARALGPAWMPCLGTIGQKGNGLGLLMDSKRLSATTVALRTKASFEEGNRIKMSREPVAIFQVNCGTTPTFLLAVVHFKAERGGAEYSTRRSLATWLRIELEQFYSELRRLPIVIAGDFNGEPCEPMFGPDGFRAFRRIDQALDSNDSLQLYNPMWKLLADPLTVTARREKNGDGAGTPYGTFLAEIWHSLIDGVLVSGEWLTSEKCALHDDRLEILTHDLWHHIGKQGAHHAYPKDTKKELAITDHLPIAVNLEIL